MTSSDTPSELSPTPISGAEARRVARNAGAIAAARILSSGALFAWQLALGRLLGVFDFGVYGTVGALFAVGVPLASFSMGMIVIRDVARDPASAGRYLSATLMMQTTLALLAYIAMNAAAIAFGYDTTLRAFVAVAGISLFIDLIGNLCFDQLIAQERMRVTSAVDVGHVVVRIVLAGALLVAGFGLMGVYLATIASGLLRSGILWLALRRTGVRPQWPVDHPLARLLFANSAPLAASAFLSLAYQHADKLMTTSLVGATGTGYLTAAFVIIYGVIELLSTTILIATYPLMSRVYDGQGDLFGMIVGKLAFFTLIVSLPLSLTLTLFAPDITVPLFGVDFARSADVLRVLIWYGLVTMIANVFAQAFMVQNRQRRLLAIRVTGLGTNIGLNLLLLPQIGVIGAAAASVMAEALVLALMLRSFHADGWNTTTLLPRLLRVGSIALLVAALMLLLGGAHWLIGLVSGLALYALAVARGGALDPDDWDLLYRLTAALPGGGLIRRFWQRDVQLNG